MNLKMSEPYLRLLAEEWLDTIEDKINYEAWYLGHWHTDKRIDKMHFLFHGVETL